MRRTLASRLGSTRLGFAVWGATVSSLVACSDTTNVRDNARVGADVGSVLAAVEITEGANDVTSVRIDIVTLGDTCDETPILSELVELEAETTDVRARASRLFVLAVGSYRVCATPLADAQASEVCAPVDEAVEIESGLTTDLALVSQCANSERGGLDAIVSLNDAPAITRIELDPSTHLSVCESLVAAATAIDPNDDALTYVWSISGGPLGGELETNDEIASFSGPVGEYDVTLAVDDGHGGHDTLSFQVSVVDADCQGELDTTPPPPATNLQAAIESRRETSVRLTWTPPAEDVAGYDVAYLSVAAGDFETVIDDSNFHEATSAPDVTGSANTTLVHDLTIEKRYLFAVRPYDTAGNLGPVVATSTPVQAQFQSLVLAPPATTVPGAQWGFSVDASTDLDGDGTADLVVGQKYGDRVHIYLGAPGGTYSSAPDAVIIGPPDSGFGASVAVIGNLVGGGHEDLAVAAPTDGPVLGRVYVISGRAWAGDWVDVSDGTNPSGAVIEFPTTSPYPAHVVRLGDFDGDGDADFGVHALGYGPTGACNPETQENCDGAFLLIKGASNPSNFPSTITVPDDAASFEAYFPSAYGFYGSDWLLGVTDLVNGRSGVLAAEYQAGVQRLMTHSASSEAGFDAQVLDYGPPRFFGDTLIYDTEIGSYPGALLGNDIIAVQITNARDGQGTAPGIVDLYTLSPTDTFAAPLKTVKAGGETNNFGQILLGNRYSGRPSSYNLPFFGRDPQAPALVVGGRYYASKLPKLFMLTAATLEGLPSTNDGQELTGIADVEYLLSSVPGVNPDWTDALGEPNEAADWHGGIGFPVHDMNQDGFADIGVTEWEFESTYTGGIIVLY